MITSIKASFLSRLFSSQSKVIKKLSKWRKDWLETSLDRKLAPTEMISINSLHDHVRNFKM